MAKEMELLSFLMEQYAAYKGTPRTKFSLSLKKRNRLILFIACTNDIIQKR